MGVKRYRARRSQKGILKLTANGHYDFKFKRLKYVGLAKGLQDAANVEFVLKTVNRYSSKMSKDLLRQKEEQCKYTDNALLKHMIKFEETMAEKQGKIENFIADSINKFEIKTAQHVLNENNKIRRYVDDSMEQIKKKIKELTISVHWLEHDLYPTHENKTTSTLQELRIRIDDISKTVAEKVFKNKHDLPNPPR